jgi:uncharacterized membrane protein YbhN (UPF0104 family)
MPIDKLLTRVIAVGALGALIFGALQFSGLRARAGTMAAALGHLHASTILAALVLSSIAALLSGVEWWHLIHRLGYRVGYRGALAAYLSAGIAGYLVNSVGPVVGSSLSLRRHGVSPGRAALLTLLANALGFCGILVWTPVGLLLLARVGIDPSVPMVNRLGLGAATASLAGMAVIMVIAVHALAAGADSGRRLAGRLLGRRPVMAGDRDLSLRSRDLLALVPWTAASWISGVGALYVTLTALGPHAGLSPGLVVGAAALSSTLGSLAVIVPEGVGVSEGVLAAILVHATSLPLADCLAASLAMRALDPLTKVGLLGVVTITGNAAVTRRLDRWIVGAGSLARRVSRQALALSPSAAALRRAVRPLVPRVSWLPSAILGLGLAMAARLPHLEALHVFAMSL